MEEVALTVDAYEEFRQFEYVSAVMVSHHYAGLQQKEAFDATMKLINSLQNKFFGTGELEEDTSKVSEKEQDEFLDLMENTFAVVHGDRLRQSAAKEHQKAVTPDQAFIYNPSPKGELLE